MHLFVESMKVIIVDDHDLFRLGVRTAIEVRHPDIAVVGEAKSGAELFNLLRTTAVDILLLDIVLPDMNGIDIARRVKSEHPKIKILIISAESTAENVEEILDIGVDGFISKLNSNPDVLADALRSVVQGFDYYGKDISTIISRIYIAKKKTTKVGPEFTEQEKQIINCCHEGLSGKQIADRLHIAYKTMEWHKTNIFRKLGINSTIELMKYGGIK